ncbi:isoleucine--tRNA ligase [Peptoniphilus sp. KCTC 25270]|uniref:isoleucine--tRNA ligase n=1 Tax=Peptoniphilus sp. KCTC 25270 TaxID=2897414 RepID=UPI001E38F302|nr:isoleucine--tRNA ligase [Peptoniphilus sp. KCTC 25270]MCD1146829.1 isoleucine--tRNA ligase [Peptoniphilus sp. KCTC 25270]
MSKFQVLSPQPVNEREESLVQFWDQMDLLKRSVEVRNEAENFVFYEGPPTANGKPGIHHVMSRTLKDLTCRYKTMQGYKVQRKAGWDTHGLPVEIEIEKKLGLQNKQDIEKYGIEEFNKKCRESVFEYESLWRKMTARMGYLIDMDDPYITLDNDYIESIWWILNKMFEDGLLYEGQKILPYCPRCGTGLASHEVAQGYEEVKTPTIVMKFKAKDEDAYFLAWTTTPWTVPSNVALAVHPSVDYVKVKHSDGNVYYLAEKLAGKILKEGYEVLETMKGSNLEHREYEQILPFVEVDKKAFYIVLADYVTTEDGTGIVHTAPAFGEDDYQTGRRYDLPLVKPVDEDGKFTDTIWKGEFVHDVNETIIDYMKEKDLVFSKETILHNYPHCWRCRTPLVYYAHPSWYIEVTKFKDKLVENNNKVNWYPSFVGEKRFGNWLENLNDWAISRSRYWGTPLNIWRCKDCGKVKSIGSRAELAELAIEDITDDIELHRPYVDDVHIPCECGSTMRREPDVIDVWFDSGAMPFAQWHYPFEHKEDFDQRFPADFINEGIDQTRGWFYSLLAIATYVMGESPYKNVLVNDLILDKDGKKMSKSRGNTVNPEELFKIYGADAVRWYLMYVSPPWNPTKFDEDGLREVQSKFFRSLRNIHNFFTMYANINGVDPREYSYDDVEMEEIDNWLLSRFNNLLKSVHDDMEVYELTRAVRTIQDFVVEDFSNWYIRRNRRRFWEEEPSKNQMAVYKTTYDVLLGIAHIIAPIAPFIAEEFYQTLVGGESIHLCDYPKADKSLIQPELEEKMELVRNLVTLGRSSRENAKIKVRQPLSEVVLDGKYKETIGDLEELIKEELNVKTVEFRDDLSEFMNYRLKPNFRVVGSLLGPKIKDFTKELNERPGEIYKALQEKGEMTLSLGGEEVTIKEDYVLVNTEAKEGFDVSMENNLFVILDTNLTEDLLDEGFAREFVSKVQQLRKSNDFEILDHISIAYDTDDRVNKALEVYKDMIMEDTLADSFERKSLEGETTPLNDHEIIIEVKKL